ncbi:MMPL family transporter [Permianibacter sp. IMCC34836]|uniref:efflux RND transporter permease subunit n=1 Tax=Permianibacter fluminis TaxID=2738515 RepID=UPI0015573195|nr:MMPL family transporter [Permianibacter fluminis]NQD37257.1 MMPL family transporter [Permianibacter fluminis]
MQTGSTNQQAGSLSGVVKSLFDARKIVLAVFGLITLYMLWSAAHLKIDAGFKKNVPQEHEYMQTYFQYQQSFGGANRVLIALEAVGDDTGKAGDIFTPTFFERLEAVTKAVQSVKGVDPSQVSSLFTPNTRFTEITEEGFEGGPVVPADFKPVPEDLERVRENVLKAGIIGRLVANDFSAAMISAQLLENDPQTGEKLNYIEFAKALEADIRGKFQDDKVKVHIIGFAKVMGDVSDGAKGVLAFFAVAILITAVLLFIFTRSGKLTAWSIVCSLIAVIWQLGLLTTFGFGIDPMSILVPFLVFAIGVSHAVQVVNVFATEFVGGKTPLDCAKLACERLWVPGTAGLLAEMLGFLTLLLIKIDIIRELAITAAIGVGVVIFTNLVLLPLLLSWTRPGSGFAAAFARQQAIQGKFWDSIAGFARPGRAALTIVVALVLFGVGFWGSQKLYVGDSQAGAPQLRPDSRYNKDTAFITSKFSIGVDLISVIVEVKQPPEGSEEAANGIQEACSNFDRLNAIDEFAWHMSNVEGVQSVVSLADIAKIVNSATSEGNLNWRVLSRNQDVLAQATQRIPSSTGLLNSDCNVVPVMIFTQDHKADTISRVIDEVKRYTKANSRDDLTFRLATGAVGVMAATNEAVAAAKWPMLLGVYAAVTLLCLIAFRSVRGTICVILPLVLVSFLAEALMAGLGIGLTVATLPVVALGVGVGVDYGIYIFSRMRGLLRAGQSVESAYRETLHVTGSAVFFTGLTLAIGVATWMVSALQFQADMGKLLTFMFIVNMIGAVLLLPALAAYLFPRKKK